MSEIEITETEKACGVTVSAVRKYLNQGRALVRDSFVLVDTRIGGPALLTAVARNAVAAEAGHRRVSFVGTNSFGQAIYDRSHDNGAT